MRSTLSLFALVLAVLLITAPTRVWAADDQQPAQQQAAPQVRAFGSDAGMMFNPIKPEATADFEMVMGKLKEALAKSQDPTRQQQAKSWKLFKAQEPGPNGSVLYVFVMDPAVKGADYTVSKILSEAFPTEVQALYAKYSAAYAGGQSLINLTLVQAFGGSANDAMVEVPLPTGK